ncbi:MAG: hypothetical protein P9X22_00350, partial [Candidatus Zapsychrus exili]|nr:hypothetical protein [Candidatus Zapsychrus exili]
QGNSNTYFTFLVITLVVGIIVFISGNCCIITYKTEIHMWEKDIVACQENYEEVHSIMKDFLKDYPMEKEVYDNFKNLSFLLHLPEVKSNILLSEQINNLKELKCEIKLLRFKINSHQQNLEWHKILGFGAYIRVLSTDS